MGNNAVRSASCSAVRSSLCVLRGGRSCGCGAASFIALLVALAAWPLYPTVRDLIRNVNDGRPRPRTTSRCSSSSSSEGREPGRIEIPFTRAHFEASEVARQWPIARGWQRQLDIERNKLFYGGVLNDLTYATWLSENGVRFVALPDAPLDSSAREEAELIEREPKYLQPRWRLEHWKVYEVMLPHPLLIADDDADIRLTSLRSDEFTLDVREPGEALVRAAWTRYWEPRSGCVEREGTGRA